MKDHSTVSGATEVGGSSSSMERPSIGEVSSSARSRSSTEIRRKTRQTSMWMDYKKQAGMPDVQTVLSSRIQALSEMKRHKHRVSGFDTESPRRPISLVEVNRDRTTSVAKSSRRRSFLDLRRKSRSSSVTSSASGGSIDDPHANRLATSSGPLEERRNSGFVRKFFGRGDSAQSSDNAIDLDSMSSCPLPLRSDLGAIEESGLSEFCQDATKDVNGTTDLKHSVSVQETSVLTTEPKSKKPKRRGTGFVHDLPDDLKQATKPSRVIREGGDECATSVSSDERHVTDEDILPPIPVITGKKKKRRGTGFVLNLQSSTEPDPINPKKSLNVIPEMVSMEPSCGIDSVPGPLLNVGEQKTLGGTPVAPSNDPALVAAENKEEFVPECNGGRGNEGDSFGDLPAAPVGKAKKRRGTGF
eukprot:Rmarinus@m.9688